MDNQHHETAPSSCGTAPLRVNEARGLDALLGRVLEGCEGFLAGFEDDADQRNVKSLLSDLRELQRRWAANHGTPPSAEHLSFIRQAVSVIGQHAAHEGSLLAAGQRLAAEADAVANNREAAATIALGAREALALADPNDATGCVTTVSVWLETARRTTPSDPELAAMLSAGVQLALQVTAGNADAQPRFLDWAETTYHRLCERKLVDVSPIVVLELSGGVCQGVSVRGDVSAMVLDYDNGADDERAPEIPHREGRASVTHCSGNCGPLFCSDVIKLVPR